MTAIWSILNPLRHFPMIDKGEKDLSIYNMFETMFPARMATLNGIVTDIWARSGNQLQVVEFWGLVIE